MDLAPLAAALERLGCPSEKSADMAAQLDKRARQLSQTEGRTYDDALGHLLRLMQQGWAANSELRSPMIRPWSKVSSTPLGDFRIFTLRSDRKISPRTAEPHDFFVLDSVDWVNVLAVTPDQELVMLEQWRHGTDTIELEIPGGIMDAQDESPVATGVRELREETGYEGERARRLGRVFSNPAIQSNTTHTILVENCQLRHPTQFDSGEDLVTRLVPIRDVPGLVAAEKIRHSLVVVALYHFDLWQRGLKG